MNTTFVTKLTAIALVTLLSASAFADVTAKFAVTLSEKTHQGQGVARFAELVDKKSQGRIKIKPFYNGALGNDVQVTSSLQGGTIEFTVPQTSTLTGMVKEFEILDFPFLFSSEQEAEKVLMAPPARSCWTSCPPKD